jgi:hypothetical protein
MRSNILPNRFLLPLLLFLEGALGSNRSLSASDEPIALECASSLGSCLGCRSEYPQ